MLFYFIRLANLLCGVALDAVPYNSSSSYFCAHAADEFRPCTCGDYHRLADGIVLETQRHSDLFSGAFR